MGLTNLLMLTVGVPFIYSAGLAFLLFERINGWIGPISNEMIYRLGVPGNKYPIVIVLFSILLWWTAFYFSTLVAAWNRSKPWDNTTTRNVEEKQTGLRFVPSFPIHFEFELNPTCIDSLKMNCN